MDAPPSSPLAHLLMILWLMHTPPQPSLANPVSFCASSSHPHLPHFSPNTISCAFFCFSFIFIFIPFSGCPHPYLWNACAADVSANMGPDDSSFHRSDAQVIHRFAWIFVVCVAIGRAPYSPSFTLSLPSVRFLFLFSLAPTPRYVPGLTQFCFRWSTPPRFSPECRLPRSKKTRPPCSSNTTPARHAPAHPFSPPLISSSPPSIHLLSRVSRLRHPSIHY